jgi:hypothetical protein
VVYKGVDLAIGFSQNTRYVLGDDFSQMFWAYSCRDSARLTIYEAQQKAALNLPFVEPNMPQETYDAYLFPSYFEAYGASKDNYIFPARYGISTN